MTLKLSFSCYCFVLLLEYSKATVQLSPIWHSNCPCVVIVLFCYWKYSKATVQLFSIWHSTVLGLLLLCFAIGNTVKQPFHLSPIWTLKLFLSWLLICFAIGNTVKHRSIVSMWHSNCSGLVIVLFCYWKYSKATVQLSPNMTLKLFCLVIVLFCYWKYSKATVQLSPIWHSTCPCLVIVLFCYWKYGKATVQLSTIWHSNCSGLVIVFFAIGNTVKQSFNCLQCDTQTVLVLLLFYLLLEIQ